MGSTRHDSVKVKSQCESCHKRTGTSCVLGFSVLCKRQSSRRCPFFAQKEGCGKKTI